ncbi:hypothetical protein RYX36_017918, partial [Vicia faba]
ELFFSFSGSLLYISHFFVTLSSSISHNEANHHSLYLSGSIFSSLFPLSNSFLANSLSIFFPNKSGFILFLCSFFNFDLFQIYTIFDFFQLFLCLLDSSSFPFDFCNHRSKRCSFVDLLFIFPM